MLSLRDRIKVSLYDSDGVISGKGIIHPDHFDESIQVQGSYDGNLFYYDTVEKVVKPCAENSATISHTGTVTRGTLVQVTNVLANSKIHVSESGLIDVDDGFLDITTDLAQGELKIKVLTPHYKSVEWQLEVAAP